MKFIFSPKKNSLKFCEKQKTALKRILQISEGSKYGNKYGITKNMNIEYFIKSVPIVSYEDLKLYIEQAFEGKEFVLSKENIESWAFTSGTTSIPKLIPYTKTFKKIYEIAERRFFLNILKKYPNILRGKILIITGRICNFKSPKNLIVGSASGIMASNIPSLFKRKIVGMPEELEGIDDSDRLTYILERALNHDIRLIASSSSTYVLTLLENAIDHIGIKRLRETWPKLKLICCPCGGYGKFHIEKINELLPHVEIWDTGFGSSEGFLTTSARTKEVSGFPNADLYFFELLPTDKTNVPSEAITIDKADLGVPYELMISSPNGLLRYRMHDFVSFDRIENKIIMNYLGRSNLEVSIHGERITENQVLDAVRETKKRIKLDINSFIFVPPVNDIFNTHAYHIIVEKKDPKDLKLENYKERFCDILEKTLQNRNINYRNARRVGRKLSPVGLVMLNSKNFFEIKNSAKRYSPFFGQGKESCLLDIQSDNFYYKIKDCLKAT